MLFSVVVPVNKFRPRLLEKCLKSVLMCHGMPSKPDMQLMVVDSSGDPRVKTFVGFLGYFNYYAIEDQGMAENWNQGIKMSDGEWVHLLHDDDYNLGDFYRCIDEGCQSDAGAISVGYECVDESDKITFRNAASTKKGIVKDFVQQILTANCLVPSAVVIRRSTYNRLGYYLKGVEAAVDWEMYCRIGIAGIPWWNNPIVVSRRLEHLDSSGSMAGPDRIYHSARRAIEIIEKYIPRDLRNNLHEARRQYGHDALEKSKCFAGPEAAKLFEAAQQLLKPLSRT